MAGTTKVPWADAAWNFVAGCSEVSIGCRNCWARKMAWRKAANPAVKDYLAYRRVVRKDESGRVNWTGQVGVLADRMVQPFHWRKGRIVAVCLEGDFFHPGIPDEWRYGALAVMRANPKHDYIVLTKRPKEMYDFMAHLGWERRTEPGNYPWRALWAPEPATPLSNLCLMVSVETDAHLTARLPWLLATPAAMRGLSLEPLLGEVKLAEALECELDSVGQANRYLHWVIVGGETGGPSERSLIEHGVWKWECKPTEQAEQWVRRILYDCDDYHIPFFFKSWGGYHSKVLAPILDGRVYREFPAGFRYSRNRDSGASEADSGPGRGIIPALPAPPD